MDLVGTVLVVAAAAAAVVMLWGGGVALRGTYRQSGRHGRSPGTAGKPLPPPPIPQPNRVGPRCALRARRIPVRARDRDHAVRSRVAAQPGAQPAGPDGDRAMHAVTRVNRYPLVMTMTHAQTRVEHLVRIEDHALCRILAAIRRCAAPTCSRPASSPDLHRTAEPASAG